MMMMMMMMMMCVCVDINPGMYLCVLQPSVQTHRGRVR